MDQVSERLKKFLDHAQMSAVNLSEALGYDAPEKIYRLFRSGTNKPSVDILTDITNKFDNLSIEWLLSGKGEMLKTENAYGVVNEATEAYGRNLIPFYDADAAAGLASMEMGPVTRPSGTIDVGDMLRDSECAIRVYGNSMTPNYPSGCVIGLRASKDRIVDYGNVYVIETEDNRYFKRLFKDKEKKGYLCYSDNTKTFTEGPMAGMACYEPFVIPFDRIIRLYRVVGMIKRNENSGLLGR